MSKHTMKLIDSSHERGNIWSDGIMTVFDDTVTDDPERCYAWFGSWDDHDDATHYPGRTSEEAIRNALVGGCLEAARERAGDALTFAQVDHDPIRAAEQAALAALQVSYAVEELARTEPR